MPWYSSPKDSNAVTRHEDQEGVLFSTNLSNTGHSRIRHGSSLRKRAGDKVKPGN